MIHDKSCIHALTDSPNQKCWPEQKYFKQKCFHLSKFANITNSSKNRNLFLFVSVADEVQQKNGGDFLTCGGCHKKYDLSDLTKFVQHKVLDCSKENSQTSKGELEMKFCLQILMKICFIPDDDEKLGSPRVSGSGQPVEDADTDNDETEKKPVVRDSGANTVKSGV